MKKSIIMIVLLAIIAVKVQCQDSYRLDTIPVTLYCVIHRDTFELAAFEVLRVHPGIPEVSFTRWSLEQYLDPSMDPLPEDIGVYDVKKRYVIK